MNGFQKMIIEGAMSKMSNPELIQAERELKEMVIAEKAKRGLYV